MAMRSMYCNNALTLPHPTWLTLRWSSSPLAQASSHRTESVDEPEARGGRERAHTRGTTSDARSCEHTLSTACTTHASHLHSCRPARSSPTTVACAVPHSVPLTLRRSRHAIRAALTAASPLPTG